MPHAHRPLSYAFVHGIRETELCGIRVVFALELRVTTTAEACDYDGEAGDYDGGSMRGDRYRTLVLPMNSWGT